MDITVFGEKKFGLRMLDGPGRFWFRLWSRVGIAKTKNPPKTMKIETFEMEVSVSIATPSMESIESGQMPAGYNVQSKSL